MSRYDGLIIPRSYSEYINKTDAATLLQALQQSGVMDAAPTSGSNHPVKSGGVYNAIGAIETRNGNLNTIYPEEYGQVKYYSGSFTNAPEIRTISIVRAIKLIVGTEKHIYQEWLGYSPDGAGNYLAKKYIRFGYDQDNPAVVWSDWQLLIRQFDLNNFIKYKDVVYDDITIPQSNFFQLNTGLTGVEIIGHSLEMWRGNSGAFSIEVHQKTTGYIVGASGTAVTGLKIRWYYI